jgi:hypothetical protein
MGRGIPRLFIMTTPKQEFIQMLQDEFLEPETITYIQGGVEYSRLAIVRRKGISSHQKRFDRGSESRQHYYDIEIDISTDSDYGMETITIRSDSVKIAKDISGTIITMRVAEIIAQDQGRWKLGLSV